MSNTDPSLIRTGHSLHAAGLGIMVLLGVVPYVAAGLPMSSQNASFQRQIEKTTRLLELEPDVTARHETLSRELAASEQRRREVLQRIPESADEGQFLAQLRELVGRCELTLHSYRPGLAVKKPNYSQMDVLLDAEGTYEELCRFVAGLESLPRFCRLAGLSVDRPDSDSSNLKITGTLRIFFASTPDEPAKVQP